MYLKTFNITLIALCISSVVLSQDYYAVVKKNDETTLHYPANVTMLLYDDERNRTLIGKDDAISVIGNYTLEIEVPWSQEKEIIRSDGGLLEIFILPNKRKAIQQPINLNPKLDPDQRPINVSKPRLEKKEVTYSVKQEGLLNLLLVFENNVVFKYQDGIVRAWENGGEIKVTNKYLVPTSKGLLKVSFDPQDGETWWVWEL